MLGSCFGRLSSRSAENGRNGGGGQRSPCKTSNTSGRGRGRRVGDRDPQTDKALQPDGYAICDRTDPRRRLDRLEHRRGCGARPKEFARFLDMSIKSDNELEYHLLESRDLDLLALPVWQGLHRRDHRDPQDDLRVPPNGAPEPSRLDNLTTESRVVLTSGSGRIGHSRHVEPKAVPTPGILDAETSMLVSRLSVPPKPATVTTRPSAFMQRFFAIFP